MQVHTAKMIRHQRTDKCNRDTEMRLWRWDMEMAQRAGEMKFSMYDREDYPLVEGVT